MNCTYFIIDCTDFSVKILIELFRVFFVLNKKIPASTPEEEAPSRASQSFIEPSRVSQNLVKFRRAWQSFAQPRRTSYYFVLLRSASYFFVLLCIFFVLLHIFFVLFRTVSYSFYPLFASSCSFFFLALLKKRSKERKTPFDSVML